MPFGIWGELYLSSRDDTRKTLFVVLPLFSLIPPPSQSQQMAADGRLFFLVCFLFVFYSITLSSHF